MIQLQFTVSLVILVPVLYVCSDGRKDNLTSIHFTDQIRLAYASAPIDGDKLRLFGLVQAFERGYFHFSAYDIGVLHAELFLLLCKSTIFISDSCIFCLKISENEKIFLIFADF